MKRHQEISVCYYAFINLSFKAHVQNYNCNLWIHSFSILLKFLLLRAFSCSLKKNSPLFMERKSKLSIDVPEKFVKPRFFLTIHMQKSWWEFHFLRDIEKFPKTRFEIYRFDCICICLHMSKMQHKTDQCKLSVVSQQNQVWKILSELGAYPHLPTSQQVLLDDDAGINKMQIP